MKATVIRYLITSLLGFIFDCLCDIKKGERGGKRALHVWVLHVWVLHVWVLHM